VSELVSEYFLHIQTRSEPTPTDAPVQRSRSPEVQEHTQSDVQQSRSPCPSLVDSDNENGTLKERKTHITDAYLLAARGEHATNKQQSSGNGTWKEGTICTAFRMQTPSSTSPNDYNKDVTRELTNVTATSAASQGHSSNIYMPPAPLPEQSVGPPGLEPLITRFVEVAAGVHEDPEPQSPDWYSKAHNAFPEDNQPPISVKMSAAHNLLDTLYCDGTKSRGNPELYIFESMTKPIRKRDEYIHAKARDRCQQRQPNHWKTDESYGYTEQEWIHWYKHNPLVGADITELTNQWRKDFFGTPEMTGGMKSHTQQRIIDLERLDTRWSKKQARESRRGAWKAYLHQECIQLRQLALMFLIYPVSACDELLECWAAYMTTDEYKTEVKRSKKIKPEDIQAVADREAQRQLARNVHKIRNDLRRMRSLDDQTSTDPHRVAARNKGWQYVPARLTFSDRTLWFEYQNGVMLSKLSELTGQHGYGRLYFHDDNNVLTSMQIGSNRMQLSKATKDPDCYFFPPRIQES